MEIVIEFENENIQEKIKESIITIDFYSKKIKSQSENSKKLTKKRSAKHCSKFQKKNKSILHNIFKFSHTSIGKAESRNKFQDDTQVLKLSIILSLSRPILPYSNNHKISL